jgi:hypothetical protein
VYARPHGGAGLVQAFGSARRLRAGAHGGLHLLNGSGRVPRAGIEQRWGLDVVFHDFDLLGAAPGADDPATRFVSLGVTVEQTVVNQIVLGLSTAGEIGIDGDRGRAFGLVTHAGWEPRWRWRVRPYIDVRSEWVFARPILAHTGISAGISVGLGARPPA